MQLQLKIQLQGIDKPPVWRRVIVPGTFSLDRLHEVIQAAFSWEDRHLYQFSEKGYGSAISYGIPPDPSDPQSDSDVQDSRNMNCSGIFDHEGQTYTYLYDFGDDWLHTITVDRHSIQQPSGLSW